MVLRGVGTIIPHHRDGMVRWQMKIWLCLFYISMVDQTSSKGCPREKGFCVTSANKDVNSGVIKVNSKDGFSTNMQDACLRSCLANKAATGCEVIYSQGNRGCYVHTSKSVARGNNRNNHYCWIFSKCEGPQIRSVKKCWAPCGKKGGRCSWCGYNQYCCRRTIDDCPANIRNVALSDYHVCVHDPTAHYCVENGYQCHQHAECIGHGSNARCRCLDEYAGNGTHCERFPLLTSCGGLISSPNVRIQYPGVGQYRNNEFCWWTIKINRPFVMKFTKFDLESHKKCGFDYLEMPDGKHYCGKTAPNKLISGSNDMSITFRSNHEKIKSGFAFWIGEANCYTIGCHIYAICNTTYDVPSCQCANGYWGDGHKCKQDDECSKRQLYCHDDAKCKRKNKNYRCVCNSGYGGNGTHCREKSANGTYFMICIPFICIFCCFWHRKPRSSPALPPASSSPAQIQVPATAVTATPEPQPSSSSNDTGSGTQALPANSLPDNPKAVVSEISNINDPPPLYQPYVIPSYVQVPPETEELPPPPSYEEATRNI